MERHSLVFLTVLAVFSMACGLLDDSSTNISFNEEVPYSFTIDANKLCPQNIDCSASQATAPADQQLQPIEFAKDVDIVQATGNDKLTKYTGVFRSIEVTQIDYKVASNQLTFDLPPTTVYVGPLGSKSKDDDGVVKLATIPAVSAGANKSGTAQVSEAGRSASADIFQKLKFGAVVFAEPVVKKGQKLPPSGTANETLTIHLKFTANPQDAIK